MIPKYLNKYIISNWYFPNVKRYYWWRLLVIRHRWLSQLVSLLSSLISKPTASLPKSEKAYLTAFSDVSFMSISCLSHFREQFLDAFVNDFATQFHSALFLIVLSRIELNNRIIGSSYLRSLRMLIFLYNNPFTSPYIWNSSSSSSESCKFMMYFVICHWIIDASQTILPRAALKSIKMCQIIINTQVFSSIYFR